MRLWILKIVIGLLREFLEKLGANTNVFAPCTFRNQTFPGVMEKGMRRREPKAPSSFALERLQRKERPCFVSNLVQRFVIRQVQYIDLRTMINVH
jgi:hypothetical protein